MVQGKIDVSQPQRAEPSMTLAYLENRVREEADAAARARSIEATLAHVMLATRYAERFTQCSGQNALSAGQSWVADHRLW